MTNTHPSAPQVTNRTYNFSRPLPHLNLDKPLPPLPILVASHGQVVRRAVVGDKRERVRARKGGYCQL